MYIKKINLLRLPVSITISLAFLTGCVITNNPVPSSSTQEYVYGSSAPSEIPVSSTPTVIPTIVPSILPTVSSSPISDDIDFVSDIKNEKTTFTGTIYDHRNIAVKGVKVTAYSLDTSMPWSGNDQVTKEDGSYSFSGVPVGAKVLITASKEDWTTRKRTEIVKSILSGDLTINKFDFKDKYSIQDEPEVVLVKINEKDITTSGSKVTGETPPVINSSTAIDSINPSNVEIQLDFSEPIIKESFENNFRIYSKEFLRSDSQYSNFNFYIDKLSSNLTFDWDSNRKRVKVTINQLLLSEKSGSQARYNLFLNTDSLKDDAGNNSLEYSENYRGVIRFDSNNTSDNIVFSVKNDENPPMLSGITAKSGSGSNDIVELRFSEPLKVSGFSSPTASLHILGSPFDSWSGNNYELFLSSNGKDIFCLGQFQEIDSSGDFSGVSLNNSKLLKVTLDESRVILELKPNSLVKSKKLVVSVGKEPNINGLSFSSGLFTNLKDPAGNEILSGNTSTVSKIEVNGVQRVTTIN